MKKPKSHASSHVPSNTESTSENEHYNIAKIISVVSYLTPMGWLIAMALYGKHKSSFISFHLRQSLGLIITGALLSLLPLIGWLMNVFVFLVCLFVIYKAALGYQQKAPFLGDFYQEHLDFIR
jgi:uncharacterized membrane protein